MSLRTAPARPFSAVACLVARRFATNPAECRRGGDPSSDACGGNMETRRIKARNGEGLAFSVVGEGTGPLGDFYELLDEKTSIATIEQALASGIKVFDS